MDLMLFSTDEVFAQAAEQAGVEGVIVDWEREGKGSRQADHDLEINQDTPDDAARMARALSIPVTVRINGAAATVPDEVELALACGAKEIMLPMAKSSEDVTAFLECLDGRAQSLVQIETAALVQQLDTFAELSWDRAYIGLNDLMISRGGQWIWEAVADGTVEHIMRVLSERQVGFGGVTVVEGGAPIPFLLLLHEMTRLGSDFSFMRRSFMKDISGRDMALEICKIRSAINESKKRKTEEKQFDHIKLMQLLEKLAPR